MTLMTSMYMLASSVASKTSLYSDVLDVDLSAMEYDEYEPESFNDVQTDMDTNNLDIWCLCIQLFACESNFQALTLIFCIINS